MVKRLQGPGFNSHYQLKKKKIKVASFESQNNSLATTPECTLMSDFINTKDRGLVVRMLEFSALPSQPSGRGEGLKRGSRGPAPFPAASDLIS